MSATPEKIRLRGEDAQELTVLQCVRKLEFYGCRSMTIQFYDAPMVVRITLEFHKPGFGESQSDTNLT